MEWLFPLILLAVFGGFAALDAREDDSERSPNAAALRLAVATTNRLRRAERRLAAELAARGRSGLLWYAQRKTPEERAAVGVRRPKR